MSCNCGHEHHHVSKEEFDKSVARFVNDIGVEIDLDAEYEKIMKKESKLSRMQRDTVVAIVEYKREHFDNKSTVE